MNDKTRAAIRCAALALSAVISATAARVSLAQADEPVVAGPVSIANAEADAMWAQVEGILKQPISSKDRFDFDLQGEQRLLKYREAGLKFYDKFPDDPRRWEWLLNAYNSPPHYWVDPAEGVRLEEAGDASPARINTAALEFWRARFDKELRPAFLASSQPTNDQRAGWRFRELEDIWNEATEGHNYETFQARDYRPRLKRYQAALLAYGAEPAADETLISGSLPLDQIQTLMDGAQIDPAGQKAMLSALVASPNAKLSELAQGRARRLELYDKPLELQLRTFDGRKMDVASLRGKIVLVDVWSLSCSSCIAAMPQIKTVYDRYHQRGFEVVGVCLISDEAREKTRVLRVLKDTGAETWTNMYAAGDDYKKFSALYSVTSVPVTWLLNREGRLVATDVHREKLEEQLKRLLNPETASL